MKQTILFVDDDKTLLSGLQRMLRPMRDEWNTTYISNPTEAVKAMNSTCFDVVVTDMRMPSIDGARLLSEVRSLCPHSVRIVLSGQAELEVVLRAVQHAHQYISKPCDAEVLKEVIRQACRLKGVISSITLREFIAQIRCLPINREAGQAVESLLKESDPDLSKLSRIIGGDIGMCSKLLQLVNSSFFTSTRTPSCADAVQVLGLDLLKQLILEQGIFQPGFTDSPSQALVARLNEHSSRVADLTRDYLSASKLPERSLDQYYIGAFLHDIGRLVLATFDPASYESLSAQSFSAWDELLEAERQLFGASHEEVGAYFLRLWGFTESTVHAASAHHSVGGGIVGEVLGIIRAFDQEVHQTLPVEPVH